MNIIVIDASAFIDLAKGFLIEEMFSLPYEFTIPDVMFESELLDIGNYDKRKLADGFLRVGNLDPKGVEIVMKLQSIYKYLSIYDCFALALAETIDAILLTGDKRLKQAASDRKVKNHGVLWIVDLLIEYKSCETRVIINALRLFDSDPTIRLPKDEIHTRLNKLRKRG